MYCLKRGFNNDGSRTATGEPQPNPRKRHLVVDHIIPHRGDKTLMWDEANLQTLCPEHHNSDKQFEEKRGFSNRSANDGWPTDPRHPVNRQADT